MNGMKVNEPQTSHDMVSILQKAEDFAWDSAIETIDDRLDYGEERWIALGLIQGQLHVLIYTYRTTKIRIISLRKANAQERKYYGSL